jgi:type I restriction enzyme, S subunit
MTQIESVETVSYAGKWKPYPAYKDSGGEWLGEIPAHWVVERLKNTILACQNGIWGDEPVNDSSDIVCIRVADFDRTKNRVIDTNLTLRSISSNQRQNRILKRGDLLLEKSGGGELQPVGTVVLYDLDTLAVCSNFIARMAVARGSDSSFLCYLHSFLYSARLNTRSIKQNTGIQNLDSDSYLCEKVCLPSLPEQRTIAAFLDHETARINALIAKKEQLIELLQEKRAALISHAVTKGLNPTVPMKDSDVEWLGEIPAHWEVKRLKYAIQNGLVNGLFKKKDQFGSGTKLVNVVNLYRDNFLIDFRSLDRVETEQQEYENFKVLSGDIFFVRSSLKLEGVGASASIVEVPEPTVFECHTVRIRPSLKLIVPKYLINYLNSSLVRQRLIALAETTTMTTIAQPKLAALEVIVPPIPEQYAIAIYLDNETAKIDALISRIREDIEKLKEYSSALISAAVTGKIDVRETIGDNSEDR